MLSKILGWVSIAMAVTAITALLASGVLRLVMTRDSGGLEINSLQARAEAGNAHAQFSYGLCRYNGEGGAIDLVEAYKWFYLAKAFKHATASVTCKMVAYKMTVPRLFQGVFVGLFGDMRPSLANMDHTVAVMVVDVLANPFREGHAQLFARERDASAH